MMKEKSPNEGSGWGQVQIGTSSLVLIFTVLCLVIFSTLSLASAKADQRLAEKNYQYVTDYYTGDGQAEVSLKRIDSRLGELITRTDSEEEFENSLKEAFKQSYNSDTNRLIYSAGINKEQFLLVELEPSYFKGVVETGKNYKIKAWIVKNKVDYEIYDDMPVWDGNSIQLK